MVDEITIKVMDLVKFKRALVDLHDSNPIGDMFCFKTNSMLQALLNEHGIDGKMMDITRQLELVLYHQLYDKNNKLIIETTLPYTIECLINNPDFIREYGPFRKAFRYENFINAEKFEQGE